MSNSSEASSQAKPFPKWLLYALLSLFWWGLFGFLGKVGSGKISPAQMQVLYMIGFIPILLMSLHRVQFKGATDLQGISFSILMGLCSALGILTFFVAMKTGKISIVAPATSLYPVITVILALAILKEKLNRLQIVGLSLSLIAIVILSL